ncbi:TatD family deoxyribonuclease [Mesoplasma syrphidae]|uniref:TatD family deoxyribonuclease n=1 Tax=Mesoplasma syrphidae TaxID=225999 RepID=A0A2K9BQD1_9MOLU|nr:TatD family hydrolase [Mesoplasma syrphidae]AUF83222.1 TatD family deoxyribonuclease [Mesoplasma syrphidae]
MIDNKKIFDAHIHFNDETFFNDEMIADLLEDGYENNVGGWLCASFDIASSLKAIRYAEKYDDIYAAIAIHPNEVSNQDFSNFEILKDLATKSKVIAIGETGLDYFYTKKDMELQKEWFIKHIQLANENNLVLQMHIRDEKDQYQAYDDTLEILKVYQPKKMIVHCFSANIEYAKKFLEIGAYINIGGAVTFKNAKDLQAAAEYIPLDKILLETDAPYLTPHPHRGKTNYPKYIFLTAQKVAELKNTSLENIIEATTKNAKKIFEIE